MRYHGRSTVRADTDRGYDGGIFRSLGDGESHSSDDRWFVFARETGGREGAAPPWHIHHPNDELFFVLDGHMTGFVRDENGEVSEFPSDTGDMFYIPKGTEHSFRLDEESKVLVMTFQPGFEHYFVELGTPVSEYELPPESAPTEEKMAEIAAISERYGMGITGPLAGMNPFRSHRRDSIFYLY